MITPRYLDPLEVRLAGAEWALLREFRFDSAVLGARLVVPAGFHTDFASVPRWPLAYLVAGNTAHAPAVLHDFACRVQLMPRAQADALFLEAMGTDGRALGIPQVSTWRATLMYAGVRVGHWMSG